MDNPQAFQPAKYVSNAHLQTVWSYLFRPKPQVVQRRERFTLSDGDFVDLDWAGPTDKALVLILHGLTGSSESLYALGLQRALEQQGIGSLVMNFRGCSGEPNRSMKMYHSGETGDVKQVYQWLRQRYPQLPIAAVGYSLGGNVLLKWLGETAVMGQSPNLTAAVAVSVPYQLDVAGVKMNQGFSRIYRNSMLNTLKTQIINKIQLQTQHPAQFDADLYRAFGKVSQYKTFTEFDGNVVATTYGFKSALDYYLKSSSSQFLQYIAVPTLLIHSSDDPFMTPEVIPTPDQLAKPVQLELYPYGGHVGFISGTVTQPVYWLEQRIPAWISTFLSAANPASGDQQHHRQLAQSS